MRRRDVSLPLSSRLLARCTGRSRRGRLHVVSGSTPAGLGNATTRVELDLSLRLGLGDVLRRDEVDRVESNEKGDDDAEVADVHECISEDVGREDRR